ncbi:MAG: 4-(cytidine 5'-diphospho)-2-C-methyl-D-erythritol kinase [Flavobacteriales bacterium]|jgi:4-diphosphocytidyl-2-C-methyl-D-erythritol kinase|nr:4-(cytidine 5'-diphospho)-2-C-methyl-D-erythritol kinase [Flavobacteriales bacterium]MCB0758988.1 4-(cytidine 5'-diphospho)-2-C-methyl-D-erythritol kinase [Flavobacteriales bacterium]
MLIFPYAKINLGLQVLRKRPDGYHDIRSVLFPIPLHDALEAVVDDSVPRGEVRFARTGIPVPGDPASDLCLKAVEQVRKLRELPGLRMHLHKAIPTGAGLGGGSSDGAHTLLLLNDLLNIQIPRAQLHPMAAELGSDCPFFLEHAPQLAEGRGEVLSPAEPNLSGHWLVLVNPGIHVPTAEVYGNLQLRSEDADLRELLTAPITSWQGTVVNDMEEYVFAKHPAIGAIKEELLAKGASYAAMSGSGSSVFGVFSKKPVGLRFAKEYGMWVFPALNRR